jgi:hypothetical protein
MKIPRYIDRKASSVDTHDEERAQAEELAREKFPAAEWVRAGLYGDRVYVEVHANKRTEIYGYHN